MNERKPVLNFFAVSIFPEMFKIFCSFGIFKKALEKKLIGFQAINLRDYTTDKHRTTDDYQYGGGHGMVMKVEPFFRFYDAFVEKYGEKPTVILPTPKGRLFNNELAMELSKKGNLIFFCGRYEGIDERISVLVDYEVSIGDYVLSGGELPAMVMMDAISRFVPGVVGDFRSVQEDSITMGLLDYPHYTRPEEFRGLRVPEVLLSGDHKRVELFRLKESIKLTALRRPDLFLKKDFTKQEKMAILEILRELLDGAQ